MIKIITILLLTVSFSSYAGCYKCTTMTITQGISDNDLSAGIATAMASGGHQFDYSTTDWQGSIVGAWQLEEESKASFSVGKRFNYMDALLHVTYTPNGSDDWVMVGGTFRF